MPPAYNSGEAARAAATARAARRRKPRRQAPPKRSFQSGEAARGYATARAVAPRKAATFKRQYTAPAPRPTPAQAWKPTATQLRSARAQRAGYVSQGKAVARQAVKQRDQAQKQQVKSYLERTPEQRRKVLAAIADKPAASRSRGERRIQRIHKARHRADVKLEKQIGFVPRIKYGYTPKTTKYNVMPVPKNLERAKAKGYLERDPKKLKAAGFAPPGVEDKIAELPKHLIKGIANTPKDVGELAIGTPTTLAHLGVQQVGGAIESGKQGSIKPWLKASEKTVREIAKPYTEAYHHPKEALEHPIPTALLFAGIPKGLNVGAGKVARATGVQKLERPPARLPGTTITQRRLGSRKFTTRAKQAREDKGKPPLRLRPKPIPRRGAKLTPQAQPKPVAARVSTERTVRHPSSELDRRVDEFFDMGQQQKAATQQSETKALSKEIGRLGVRKRARRVSPRRETRAAHRTEKAERAERVRTQLEGASAGAAQHVERKFAKELGSHRQVTDKGLVYEPKNAPEGGGVIHADRADAVKVAENLKKDKSVTWDPVIVELEGKTEGVTQGYAVIPKQAADRFRQHKHGVGKAGWGVGPTLRISSRAFRQTVLPTSTKWLGGQVVEGGVRSAVHGAGPIPVVRYARGKRFLTAYERVHRQDALKAGKTQAEAARIGKQARAELEQRTTATGQFGVTGPASEYARQLRGETKGATWEKEYAGSALEPLGKAATGFGAKPVVRHARAGYRRFAETVFNDINGPIERAVKVGMLGKEVKRQSPLLDRRIVGLSAKSLDEAARGLKGTGAQVELGRGLARAYGQYSQFSPTMRDTIMHTTPFIPWFINMGNFLTRTLPREHPVKTSLLTSLNQADQEWRKKHRMSFYSKDRVPNWLMGTYPSKGGKYPASRFMPFLPGEYVGAGAGQINPQYFGAVMNAAGVDWKGEKIPGGEGRHAANVALTLGESLVPGVSIAGRLTGLSDQVRGKTKKPNVIRGDKKVDKAVLDMLNPIAPIKATGEKKKKKAKKKGGSYGNLTGGGGGGSYGNLR